MKMAAQACPNCQKGYIPHYLSWSSSCAPTLPFECTICRYVPEPQPPREPYYPPLKREWIGTYWMRKGLVYCVYWTGGPHPGMLKLFSISDNSGRWADKPFEGYEKGFHQVFPKIQITTEGT